MRNVGCNSLIIVSYLLNNFLIYLGFHLSGLIYDYIVILDSKLVNAHEASVRESETPTHPARDRASSSPKPPSLYLLGPFSSLRSFVTLSNPSRLSMALRG